MRSDEFHLQEWFDIYLTSKGILHNASVSAFKTSIGVAVKMKRGGYKKGFSDVQICIARGGYHGLFIELKIKGGHITPEQEKWRDDLLAEGYLATIMPTNLDYRQCQDYLERAVEIYMGLK